MKRVVSLLAVLACIAVSFGAFATLPAPSNADTTVLPQAPMFEAIAEFQGEFMTEACAVIRPVATHSQCNYFLCEQHGCGAPFYFDPVDCACHCGYAF